MEEHVLRRALRLDADEVPPRLDPALVAVAARAAVPGQRELVAIAVAFAAGWIWSEVFRAVIGALLAAFGADPFAAAIDAFASVALGLAPLAAATMQPAVPVAILTAAVVAALSERTRRSYAPASSRTQHRQ